jgi:mycothiol synthase
VFTGEELRAWWARRPEHLETDIVVAELEGQLVGYAGIDHEGPDLANVVDESCVHPDYRGRGIGTRLVAFAESWTRERNLSRLHMHAVNDDGRRLFEAHGFELIRFFWRMEIELGSEPPEPKPPDGFELRAYEPGLDDEALHAMHQEAFAEHWEFTPHPLETWLAWRVERTDYDPVLWRLAVHGDQIAGAALAFGSRSLGWILDLAVGPRWRRRGLGLALLQSSFRELYAGGVTRVGLEVDSENETGATRLYERAGMHVTRKYATFEKQLRA